jgi:hypothetical protein
MDDEVMARIKRAAESILTNESLTADLDDETAQILLDWGVAWAESIAGATAGLEETEAETLVEPRLRAVRKLLRLAQNWLANRPEGSEAQAAQLEKIIEQATIIFGQDFVLPDNDQLVRWVQQQLASIDDPAELARQIRQLLEDLNSPPATKTETPHDQV